MPIFILRAMLGTLKKRGLEIKKDTAGIYAVKGWLFPLQVVVLNEPLDPEVDYMFAIFKTGPRKQRAKAWAVLIKKYLANPADPEPAAAGRVCFAERTWAI